MNNIKKRKTYFLFNQFCLLAKYISCVFKSSYLRVLRVDGVVNFRRCECGFPKLLFGAR